MRTTLLRPASASGDASLRRTELGANLCIVVLRDIGPADPCIKVERKREMWGQKIKIGGIIQNRNLAKIGVMSIPDRPGVAGAIFSALGERNINIPFIVHTIDLNNLDNIVICVAREDLTVALEALNTVKETVGAKEIVYKGEVGILSMFGPHFGERPGIAGVMFSALASAGINILAISTSISSTSCLVDVDDMDEAIQSLEEAFELP
jgi:aspartate kinase